MVLNSRTFLSPILALVFLLAACGVEGNQAPQIPIPNPDQDSPGSLPSPVPEKVLSICLGAEPESLFLYGDQSISANIIRQAIYDNPVDEVDFQFSSILLEEIPSQANELVLVVQVEVKPGERIVDSKGNLSILASGVVYRPSGCAKDDCLETYQNQAPVMMDQVEITFPVQSGINWSDGTPLTALDSEFSYQVARDIYGSLGPRNVRYTASYEAVDQKTILWKGVPGFLGIYSYPEYLFRPLPKHLWGDLPLEELFTLEKTTQLPLSWGPYRIVEWIIGDHISLVRNEEYHSIADGGPEFDYLVFRFVSGGEEALAAYYAGECDIIANEPGIFDYFPDLAVQEGEGELNLSYIAGGAWEQISFGINSLDPKRVLLQDPRTRQAITQCINREKIATGRTNAGAVVEGLYLPEDPRNISSLHLYPYQPALAKEILEEMGWIDHDQDPTTPRIAFGVPGVKEGTAFQLSLLVAGSEEIPLSAESIQKDLEVCGIEIQIDVLPADELLAPGPEGPIFGREFDLALFAWSTGPYHLCQLFISDEIPGIYPLYPKGWGGTNASGYNNQEFDAYCSVLLNNLPDSLETKEAVMRVQEIFTENLPVLPLFFRHQLILSRPGLVGFQSGNFQPLWNLEKIH